MLPRGPGAHLQPSPPETELPGGCERSRLTPQHGQETRECGAGVGGLTSSSSLPSSMAEPADPPRGPRSPGEGAAATSFLGRLSCKAEGGTVSHTLPVSPAPTLCRQASPGLFSSQVPRAAPDSWWGTFRDGASQLAALRGPYPTLPLASPDEPLNPLPTLGTLQGSQSSPLKTQA